MDKYTNLIFNDIKKLEKRLENLNKKYNKNNEKKELIFYDNIKKYLSLIDEEIDNFEVNNEKYFDYDKEIISRIEENKKFKNLINKIGPLIILYQLQEYNNF